MRFADIRKHLSITPRRSLGINLFLSFSPQTHDKGRQKNLPLATTPQARYHAWKLQTPVTVSPCSHVGAPRSFLKTAESQIATPTGCYGNLRPLSNHSINHVNKKLCNHFVDHLFLPTWYVHFEISNKLKSTPLVDHF